jgi:N-acetylglucosaminyldiphosphoundecaprenol N-acetyl-beta-D-mannosaminyltransferase
MKANKIDTQGLIFGLTFFGKPMPQLLKKIEQVVSEQSPLFTIATPNPEQVVQASKNHDFAVALSQFDLLLPDGNGIVWASKLLAHKKGVQKLNQRLAGREVVVQILKIAESKNLSVLVVGGRDYQQLSEHYPVVSWAPAYENVKHPTVAEEIAIKELIDQTKPDIVFVAFGAPEQELWVEKHRGLLAKNKVKIAMVVGGSFDYLLGKVPQVPTLVNMLGMEWLFRLITQPWRWRRQLRLIEFSGMVLKDLLFVGS